MSKTQEALNELKRGLQFGSVTRAIALLEQALAEQPAKEKAPQSANCEAPGWISSDHARRDDCNTEQPAQRQPLTTDQITAGLDIDSLSAAEIAAFHSGIRWAEEQHGIGGKA